MCLHSLLDLISSKKMSCATGRRKCSGSGGCAGCPAEIRGQAQTLATVLRRGPNCHGTFSTDQTEDLNCDALGLLTGLIVFH